jgi:hypothetical protein
VPAEARLNRLVIEPAESPAHQGRLFGETGRYQRLTGHAAGEPDPKDPLKAVITDIQFPPRNAPGMVEDVATFSLGQPVESNQSQQCESAAIVQEQITRRASFRWTAARISNRACDRGWEIREAMEHAPGRDDQFQRADEGAAEKVRLVEPWTRTSDDRIDYRFRERFSELGRNHGRGENAWNKGETLYDNACHADNFGLYNILAGARAGEQKAVSAKEGTIGVS